VSESGISDTTATGRADSQNGYGNAPGRECKKGVVALDIAFMGGVDARKGRWREPEAEAKCISTGYFWTRAETSWSYLRVICKTPIGLS
jgi:hypothetical protein